MHCQKLPSDRHARERQNQLTTQTETLYRNIVDCQCWSLSFKFHTFLCFSKPSPGKPKLTQSYQVLGAKMGQLQLG